MTKEELLEYVDKSSLFEVRTAINDNDFILLKLYSETEFKSEHNKHIPRLIKNYLRTLKLKQYD
jgi:hypothetical protein